MLSFSKEKNKKKCNSATKQNINHFENTINKKDNKDSQSSLIYTTDNQNDYRLSKTKDDEKNDFDFENEEITQDCIDELFSELL